MQATGDRQDIPPSPDHPLETTPEEALDILDITDEDKAKLVSIITTYRTGWAPDRLLRMAAWMRNDLMYRGHQLLGWDQSQGVWYDALALYMGSGQAQEGDDTYLQSFQNNITKMLGTAFVGTMSRSVPPTVIRPENAEIEADVTTAKAAQEAIEIIERMNDIRGLVRAQNTMLYLFGAYFKHTRTIIDGSWAGYDEVPDIQTVTPQLPDRYHCSCGKDVPIGQNTGTDDGGMGGQEVPDQAPSQSQPADAMGKSCPGCGKQLGPADFYPAETGEPLEIQVGMKKVPRAMIKWTIHSPLEFDADPEAKKIKDSPIAALDMEIDVGTARRIFPAAGSKIKEGAVTSTTPNAGFERLRRNESYSYGNSYTADSFNQKPTYSQVWVQPDAYYREGEEKKEGQETFADRMMAKAPDGLKISMIGDEVVDVRKACLEKEWTHCVLIEGCGLYPPSVADDVVPFNIRINGAMDILDDHYETCSAGIILADGRKLDRREMVGKQMVPGQLNFVKTTSQGQVEPLENALWQFQPQIDAGLSGYVPMLWNLAQQIASLPPQVFGTGTQEGVDTARGQAQQLSQAQLGLDIFFENEKAEHAAAAQNAIEELQKDFKRGLINEIRDVIETSGSQYRNKYVNLKKMSGRVKVYPMPDQGLPQSPEQERDSWMKIMEEAGGGNQLAIEIMSCIPNQEIAVARCLPSEVVLPGAAQRSRTLQHVNTILETPEEECPLMINPPGPDGIAPPPGRDLPVKPEIGIDDFPTAKATIKLFRQENFDLIDANPFGKMQLAKYYDMLDQLDAQEMAQKAQRQKMVTQAGAPDPDPQEQAAKKLLLQDGAQAVQDLANIAAIPPQIAIPGKALPAVVSAGGKIVDNALKLAK